jgi:hypothetical protein
MSMNPYDCNNNNNNNNNACSPNPCQNAGQCQLTGVIGEFKCNCPPGFSGKFFSSFFFYNLALFILIMKNEA